MNGSPRPPRVAERILTFLLHPDDRSDAVGDLHEEFRLIASRSGVRAARRWYRSQVVRSIGPSVRRRSPRRRMAGAGMELRLALRTLRRAPVRSGLWAGILILGIGSSTAIFSVVDQVLLRPLPYDGADRLYSVWNVYPDWREDEVLGAYWDQVTVSWPEYLDLRTGSESLEASAAYGFSELVLEEPGDPTRITVGFASGSLFGMLGVRPRSGRVFTVEEEGDGAPLIAVVSHGFWVDRMGADENGIGSAVRIQGRDFQVVGVLPEGFRLRGQSPFGRVQEQDLWVPIGTFGSLDARGNRNLEAMARLAPQAGRERAENELSRLVWGEEAPESRRVRLTPRHAEEVEAARIPLLLLLGSALLLMAIVAANVTTLRIGSVAMREREWATRAALGAGRSRIRRLLLVESLVIGMIGMAGGAALAAWVIASWVGRTAPELMLGVQVGMDFRALVFAAVVGLAVSVVAGRIPLTRVRDGMHGSSVGRADVSPGRGAGVLQRSLLVTQVALSLVLLSGAALFSRSLGRIGAVDPGFRADGIVTLEVSPNAGSVGSVEEALGFHARVGSRIAAVPGVIGVGATSFAPFGRGLGSNSFEIASSPSGEGERSPEGLRRNVTPGFFDLLDVPVLEGRGFRLSDGMDDPLVAVVSRSMADVYWPGRTPIGDAIVRGDRSFEIVGIVGDVTRADLTAEPEPTFYVAIGQEPLRALDYLIRVERLTPELSASVREAVWAEDPSVPLPSIDTLSDRVRRSMVSERFRSRITAFFGGVAALLVALGLFGIAVQGVVRRTREIGVRMALGATSSGVSRMIIRKELRVVWTGLVIGLLVVVSAGRVLSGLLFGIGPTDLPALASAALALIAIAVVAVWIPALRAARLDPARVLTES